MTINRGIQDEFVPRLNAVTCIEHKQTPNAVEGRHNPWGALVRNDTDAPFFSRTAILPDYPKCDIRGVLKPSIMDDISEVEMRLFEARCRISSVRDSQS
jgi:hypothetical protein